MFWAFLIYPFCAFLAVGGLIPFVRKVAPQFGLVDAPGGRKDHVGKVPLIGGLVIFPVFIAFSWLNGDTLADTWPLYTAIALLLITGAVDDLKDVPAKIKFAIQFVAAALIVVPGGATLYSLGDLFGLGAFGLNFMGIPFSIVAVVLLINAINLMDGLDGLAGGVSFIILFWFAFAGIMGGELVYTPTALILMGCLLGFLVFNMRNPWRRKASAFLGDAGSLCLGLMVSWYAIQMSDINGRVIEPMSVAWVLALPIWDECAQFYRRVREGRHPFSPDRGHFHHHFIAAGFTPKQATAIILMMVFAYGAFGVLLAMAGVPIVVLTVLWILGILSHMRFSANLENYPKLLRRLTASTRSST